MMPPDTELHHSYDRKPKLAELDAARQELVHLGLEGFANATPDERQAAWEGTSKGREMKAMLRFAVAEIVAAPNSDEAKGMVESYPGESIRKTHEPLRDKAMDKISEMVKEQEAPAATETPIDTPDEPAAKPETKTHKTNLETEEREKDEGTKAAREKLKPVSPPLQPAPEAPSPTPPAVERTPYEQLEQRVGHDGARRVALAQEAYAAASPETQKRLRDRARHEAELIRQTAEFEAGWTASAHNRERARALEESTGVILSPDEIADMTKRDIDRFVTKDVLDEAAGRITPDKVDRSIRSEEMVREDAADREARTRAHEARRSTRIGKWFDAPTGSYASRARARTARWVDQRKTPEGKWVARELGSLAEFGGLTVFLVGKTIRRLLRR